MDQPVIRAIHALAAKAKAPATLLLCGSTACFIQKWIVEGRNTGDCDVLKTEPPEAFHELQAEAAKIAAKHGLAGDWLNDKVKKFRWKLPIGWEVRAVPAEKIGPLTIMTLCRKDLVASKVMGQRPHDIEDLRAMKPTGEELDHAEANLDRVEAEDLDGAEYPKARAILAGFRKELAGRPARSGEKDR